MFQKVYATRKYILNFPEFREISDLVSKVPKIRYV